jgi:hypothetical protein
MLAAHVRSSAYARPMRAVLSPATVIEPPLSRCVPRFTGHPGCQSLSPPMCPERYRPVTDAAHPLRSRRARPRRRRARRTGGRRTTGSAGASSSEALWNATESRSGPSARAGCPIPLQRRNRGACVPPADACGRRQTAQNHHCQRRRAAETHRGPARGVPTAHIGNEQESAPVIPDQGREEGTTCVRAVRGPPVPRAGRPAVRPPGRIDPAHPHPGLHTRSGSPQPGRCTAWTLGGS